MEEKRKVGRPKKKPEDLKNRSIIVRFTEEELDLLKQKAKEYGMTVSDCIREAIDLVYKL
jgi:predicted DNA binding CopG/RHH family protein